MLKPRRRDSRDALVAPRFFARAVDASESTWTKLLEGPRWFANRRTYSVLWRPCFDSYFATSALRSFSIKLERLLFSCLASARSLAFKARSIFSEMVVSFIFLPHITT